MPWLACHFGTVKPCECRVKVGHRTRKFIYSPPLNPSSSFIRCPFLRFGAKSRHKQQDMKPLLRGFEVHTPAAQDQPCVLYTKIFEEVISVLSSGQTSGEVGMCFWEEGGDHTRITCIFRSRHAFVENSFCLDDNFEMGSEEDGRARSCSHVLCDGVLPFHETVTSPFVKEGSSNIGRSHDLFGGIFLVP